MIHFITCHFGIDDLIDIQLKYIDKCTHDDYKVWMSYTTPTALEAETFDKPPRATWFNPDIIDNHESIINNNKHKVHHFEHIPITPAPVSDRFNINNFSGSRFIAGQNHQNNLHVLTEKVLQDDNTSDDDILVWLDNDTLPVANIDEIIDTDTLVAVQRNHKYHSNGKPSLLPHPLFTSCNVGFFKQHNLNWTGGMRLRKEIPDIDQSLIFADTGGCMYAYLEMNNIPWCKLHKTYSLHDDDQYFEIYGDVILHIGSVSLSNARVQASKIYSQDDYARLYNDIISGKKDLFNEQT
jgi:hypothetical protein